MPKKGTARARPTRGVSLAKRNRAAGRGRHAKAAKKAREKTSVPRKVSHGPLRLQRFEGNPILEPAGERSWESKATFNPGVFYDNGKVHLLYRAIGDTDMSVLGYAVTANGVAIDERHPHPVYAEERSGQAYTAREFTTPILYGSGGGWSGGCEDPRITRIGDTVHMIYTAFDGWGSVRLALTSIALDDFRKKRWHWKKPVFISPPGEIHKNWVLFPEKIKGKYAILHSISPDIAIAYFDSLDRFDGTAFINNSRRCGTPMKSRWDSLVRGVGPPPMKVKDGWLVLYHAVDHRDPGRYKLGAMLLDRKNPEKIRYRSSGPILEPDEFYENEGFKAGVVYSCGAAIVDDTLFIYYGGADTFVCVATADLTEFLSDLKRTGLPKIRRAARGA